MIKVCNDNRLMECGHAIGIDRHKRHADRISLFENMSVDTNDEGTPHFLIRMQLTYNLTVFSSPEPKAHGELIVYQSSRRLSVCLSVCSHFQT